MNLEDLPDVPPAAMLLLNDVYARSSTQAEARKRLREIIPELARQSEVYEFQRASSIDVQEFRRDFDIHLEGALNFFSASPGRCSDVECRVVSAIRTARSMGLIADHIWLTDHFTERFLDFGAITEAKLDEVIDDLQVLAALAPLISAGVLKFKSPWHAVCDGCIANFESRVDALTEELFYTFSEGFSVEKYGDDLFAIYTGELFEPQLVLRLPKGHDPTKSMPGLDGYARRLIRASIHSAMWMGREAAVGGGAVFSSSRVGMTSLAFADRRVKDMRGLRLLDESRAFDLPWVNELNVAQIVQLRQEASNALPQFRELLASKLTYCEGSNPRESEINVVGELRQQAVEVQQELSAIGKNSGRLWRTTFTMLSLGVAAIGLATDQPLAAAGGLLNLLQLLGTHGEEEASNSERIKRQPAYVLVKARELLAHAQNPI